jgi:hypothetical protein
VRHEQATNFDVSAIRVLLQNIGLIGGCGAVALDTLEIGHDLARRDVSF